ncbi:ATP phosphoribosyltransferase regulatory subunit [Sterolibacterium denitrificans]|uniref:ATP phosphoribosyltransferase regulatory subunit n=1 Tax=Sterolibacterium denitrificans TaxID=157592 RepID=A0A7Z7HQS8_9PROT|nr:ATP phosphoribosyltransferase regulatory subunit [Sterolibacterium denitrificans]SMB25539.1 ATP phosphoribosyltransferase regulatory subunit [Sterolibacterium denitrificans]
MRRWLLPEAIEDALPAEAWHVETLRRRLLDEFHRHGYEYVIPPLLEYVESLLTGSGRDLDLRTFKLVDQLSGRTMGVRADIAPQVARIDAHLLNRKGVTRLCYCGSVLHTLPANLTATRQPLQIGAELYGHAGGGADAEILHLLARALQLSGVAATRIDLGHVGVFRALAAGAGFAGEHLDDLFGMMQAKDLPGLRELLADVAEPCRAGLLALPALYGDVTVLARAAATLPALPEITAALDELRALAATLGDLPISFDLGDLRGLHYHSGVVFAAYCAGYPGAIALGGRYDKVGKAFGRDRAATGFSLDLRELAQLAPNGLPRRAIVAPQATAGEAAALRQAVAELRAGGEIVINALPGDTPADWHEAGCDRQLVWRDGRWQTAELK